MKRFFTIKILSSNYMCKDWKWSPWIAPIVWKIPWRASNSWARSLNRVGLGNCTKAPCKWTLTNLYKIKPFMQLYFWPSHIPTVRGRQGRQKIIPKKIVEKNKNLLGILSKSTKMKPTKSRKKYNKVYIMPKSSISQLEKILLSKDKNNKAHPHAPCLPQNQLTTTNWFLANVPVSWG